MQTIYKYPIEAKSAVTLQLPKGAEILSFNTQARNDELFIWAIIDTEAPLEDRRFLIVGTGHSMDPNYEYQYIGVVHSFRKIFVFHLFEVLN